MEVGLGASMLSLREHHSPELHVFTNPKLSQCCFWGFLWRLHYVGMIDKIIGHWQFIQPPALPSTLEFRGEGEQSGST